MEEKFEQLKNKMREIMDIEHSISLLGWDQQVFMPEGGAIERGFMIGTLGKIAHEKFTSDEVGVILEELKKYLPQLDPDGEYYRIIQVTVKDFEKNQYLPSSYIVERANVISRAQQAWFEAKANSDYSVFLPHLSKVLELCRQYVTFFPSTEHPYDVFLNDYEPGIKTSEVKTIFDEIRMDQVELIRNIKQQPQIEDGFLHLDYEKNKMWEFSTRIASSFGFNWKHGRQDPSVHPFCQSIGPDDVRITSRWVSGLPFALLFGTMHETGHALYEQGIGRTWSRTLLENGASLGIHESQSRMWENLIGRSRSFWQFFYPQLQELFSSQLGNVSIDQFYRAINKVSPSLIRVEADEATYNLHIMLRFEIETALIEGQVHPKNLPEMWNKKMEEYFGLVPTNDANGILQDIHWSGGMFGYFPTYALGNLISAQLMEKFQRIYPDLNSQISQGDFSSLLSWLGLKIHQYGRKYEPHELLIRTTGMPLQSRPYLHYLKKKYGEIYDIN